MSKFLILYDLGYSKELIVGNGVYDYITEAREALVAGATPSVSWRRAHIVEVQETYRPQVRLEKEDQ
jgi:hypothetical protein